MIHIRNCKTYKAKGERDIYIGRPSILGNPYPITRKVSRERCIRLYKIWLLKELEDPKSLVTLEIEHLKKLAVTGDLNLICWCHPLPCHGDVIKEILEKDE